MSRIVIAFYFLSFLIFLSLLESIFSFMFSLALQRPVVFPLVQWFLLLLEWGGYLFILCGELFFLFIAVALDPQTYGQQMLTKLGDLGVHFAVFPSVLFYPLVLIFGDVLAALPAELVAEGVEEAAAAQRSPGFVNLVSGFISAITVGLATSGSSEGEDENDRLTRLFGNRGG